MSRHPSPQDAERRLQLVTAHEAAPRWGPQRGVSELVDDVDDLDEVDDELDPNGSGRWLDQRQPEPRDDALPARGARAGGRVAQTAQQVREFGRAHLLAMAVVLGIAVLATAGLMMRARASTVPLEAVVASAPPGSAVPGPSVASASRGATPGTAPTPTASPVPLQVHVVGAVRRPGVVRLASGSRIHDAIEAAGGLRRDAHPGQLNLAAPVVDGDQVSVSASSDGVTEVRHASADAPVTGGSGGPAVAGPAAGGGSSGGSTSGSGAVVDLNQATAEQLDQLPGVGPVTAQRILDWRSSHGRFSSVDELQEVDGIGPKTFERLKPHVRI